MLLMEEWHQIELGEAELISPTHDRSPSDTQRTRILTQLYAEGSGLVIARIYSATDNGLSLTFAT